jgi:hypothetical protein
MYSHNVRLCTWLFSLSIFPRSIYDVKHISIEYFLLPNILFFYSSGEWKIFSCFHFGTRLVLLWTFMYKFLFDHLFSISLCKYFWREVLHHIVFWGSVKLSLTTAEQFYIPSKNSQRPQFSWHSCQHLLLYYYIIIILICIKWYLLVVLTFLSFIINNVEYLVIFLLVIYLYAFKFFAHYLIRQLFFVFV